MYAPWLSWLQRPTVMASEGREFEPHWGRCPFKEDHWEDLLFDMSKFYNVMLANLTKQLPKLTFWADLTSFGISRDDVSILISEKVVSYLATFQECYIT